MPAAGATWQEAPASAASAERLSQLLSSPLLCVAHLPPWPQDHSNIICQLQPQPRWPVPSPSCSSTAMARMLQGLRGLCREGAGPGRAQRGLAPAPSAAQQPVLPTKGPRTQSWACNRLPWCSAPFWPRSITGVWARLSLFWGRAVPQSHFDTPRLPSGLAAAQGRWASHLPRMLPTPGLCQLHGFCPCPGPCAHPEGERVWVCAGARVPAPSVCTGAARCIPAQAAVCTPPRPQQCPGCRGVTEPPAEQPRGLSKERDLGGWREAPGLCAGAGRWCLSRCQPPSQPSSREL